MKTNSINYDISKRLAVYFLEHLKDELKKKNSNINTFDGKTSADINKEIIEYINKLFHNIEKEPKPKFHLFRKWFELNKFPIPYEDWLTEAYNIIFLSRIKSLLDWSEQSKQEFKQVTLNVFQKFNYRHEVFSISSFLTFENNMRELLREILKDLDLSPTETENIWKVLYDQSTFYQRIVNEFFESLLKAAYEESERLLNNILPIQVSAELKKNGKVEPVYLESVTVLFTDFKGFTQISETMSPQELIIQLDECFSLFDEIIEKYSLEKIKTIGDSFMCAAGVPIPTKTHCFDAALASLLMRESLKKLKEQKEKQGHPFWQIRIGFHTGPVVAGVIGKKKFSYDIWGDTVNTASRMESSGIAGEINISEASAQLLSPFFLLEDRGEVSAKNKGSLRMFLLKRLKPEYSLDEDGIYPSENFYSILESKM
ncbi:MAG: adenylate/guanylate cyclase domain-containing protein [Leptospiraceae bacterium]|nr:adenylate/guanylate cyclase domain-containing protein [Leptospiraceae bacterium]